MNDSQPTRRSVVERTDEQNHYHSSGRGGLGNITQQSAPTQDYDQETEHWAREKFNAEWPNHSVSTGRGGAGNIVLPSLDSENTPSRSDEDFEKGVLRKRQDAMRGEASLLGRGGAGNTAATRTIGRGGMGNFVTAENNLQNEESMVRSQIDYSAIGISAPPQAHTKGN